jgi:translation initiation factor 4E
MATTEPLAEGSTPEEVPAAVPVPAPEAGLKHKLERKWTFWFDNQSKPKQGAAWGTSLRKVYTFDTVEEFWWYVFYLGFFNLLLFD